MHTYIHTHIHACMHTCIHTDHADIHIHSYMQTYIHTFKLADPPYIRADTSIWIHTYLYAYMYIRICHKKIPTGWCTAAAVGVLVNTDGVVTKAGGVVGTPKLFWEHVLKYLFMYA